MDNSRKTTLRQRRDVGKLSREIYKLMLEGKEKEAYDKLGDLNSLLSDINGTTVEMEFVIGAIDRRVGESMV